MPALTTNHEGPEHNQRGLYVIGPQFVTPSDLLVKLQKFNACNDPTPDRKETRRAIRLYSGREAQRQRELGR